MIMQWTKSVFLNVTVLLLLFLLVEIRVRQNCFVFAGKWQWPETLHAQIPFL